MTERIGTYQVERPIGFGRMGEVFLARDRSGRRVAIQRIQREAGLSTEQRERFVREIRLAASLDHPAVAQIYEFGETEDSFFIVMENLEGRTLEERLTAGPLETEVVLRLAQEIAQGLARAHRVGLIHRDLNPGNIVVTPTGHAKILDFGLPQPEIRVPEGQGFTRWDLCMSPEQARKEQMDERSDLWSFGVLVYEMLAGQPPFRGNDPIGSRRRVGHEEPVDPRRVRPDLPNEAATLLQRLLAKDRNERPASADEVVETLARLGSAATSRSLAGTAHSLRWHFLTSRKDALEDTRKISGSPNARLSELPSFGLPLLLGLAIGFTVDLVLNGSPRLQGILGWSILGILSLLLYFFMLRRERAQFWDLEKRRQADMAPSRCDAIDELYVELRQLIARSGGDPSLSSEIQSRLTRLRALQTEEAERIRTSLNEGLHMKPGTGYQALEEARRLLAEHAHPAPQNFPSSR